MEFLLLQQEKYVPQLLSLWQEAFGEEKEEVLPFFREIFPLCRCFAAVEEETVCAVVYALPQVLRAGEKELPVAYFYAIATKKSHRGQGLASRLIAFAAEKMRAEGKAGILLVPANGGLFSFYEKLGFSVFCRRNCQEISRENSEIQECDEEIYLRARESFLGDVPHNVPPKVVLRHLRKYVWEGGCAAGEMTDKGFVFREALGDVSRLPRGGKALTKEPVTPYAMAMALSPDFPKEGYFAFAME